MHWLTAFLFNGIIKKTDEADEEECIEVGFFFIKYRLNCNLFFIKKNY